MKSLGTGNQSSQIESDTLNGFSPMPRFSLLIVFLCIMVSLVGIFGRDLWTPDEPRVAAICLEMSQGGDLVIPRLAGRPFLEKPPLYFAVAGMFIRLMGPLVGNTGAIRFTSALWGLGALLMTFLLAKGLMGHHSAFLATVFLATMWGFVENMHWIRVDAALFFFVAAALWSFFEVYFTDRPWFCLPAGFFTAGAFLSKGIIGPLIIAIAWIGMLLSWMMERRRNTTIASIHVMHHGIGFIVFLLFAGLWILLLRMKGEALWQEWFWKNHVGRLLGTTPQLGHLHAGEPFYYLAIIIGYTLPWSPLIILWLGRFFDDLRKREPIPLAAFILLFWGVGSVVFLSFSATKRDVYLLPVLPAFALMGADALQRNFPQWCKAFFMFWGALCMVILLSLTISPVWAPFLPQSLPGGIVNFLRNFSFRHGICGLGLALCIYLIGKLRTVSRPRGVIAGVIIITAFFYIGFFCVAGRAIDLEKSMEKTVHSFVGQIPFEKRARIAGWDFTETMLGCFSYYADFNVPQIKEKDRLLDIIAGQDPEYDSVIIPQKSFHGVVPINLPYYVLAEADPGSFGKKRNIQWIEGIKAVKNEAKTSLPGEGKEGL